MIKHFIFFIFFLKPTMSFFSQPAALTRPPGSNYFSPPARVFPFRSPVTGLIAFVNPRKNNDFFCRSAAGYMRTSCRVSSARCDSLPLSLSLSLFLLCFSFTPAPRYERWESDSLSLSLSLSLFPPLSLSLSLSNGGVVKGWGLRASKKGEEGEQGSFH